MVNININVVLGRLSAVQSTPATDHSQLTEALTDSGPWSTGVRGPDARTQKTDKTGRACPPAAISFPSSFSLPGFRHAQLIGNLEWRQFRGPRPNPRVT